MTTTSVPDSLAPARRRPRALPLLLGLGALLLAACGGDGGHGGTPTDSTVAEPTVEARAVWLSRYDYSTQAQLVALIDSAAAAHFNIVWFQARGNGDAWYTPGLEPWGRQLTGTLGVDPGWDPLAVAIQRAHAHGLARHAGLNVGPGWVEDGSGNPLPMPESTPRHAFLVHPDWIYKSQVGNRIPDGGYELFSPGAAGYRTFVARIAADVVRRYPALDGIHLDYIRYPYVAASSWDSASLAAFAAADSPGTIDQFRRDLVTDIVRQVRDSIVAVRASVRLSAATWGIFDLPTGWPNYATGYFDCLQDSRGWAASGIIDALVPMVYYPIAPRYGAPLDFAYLADEHVRATPNRHVYVGLDIEHDALAGNGAAMVKEINRARFAGAKGVSVFSAQILQKNNWWHVLPETVFKKVATVPGMAWK